MGIDTFRMIFKRYIIIFIIVLQAVSTVEAQDGTTAYEFLNVSASSHVYALGGTNITTIDDDVNLIDQNPGLLGPEYEMQAGLNYMRYLGGSNFMGARFTAPAGDHAAWAVGIQYFGYGSIDGYDEQGNSTGASFSPSDIAFSGTYAHDIYDRWRGGITLKFVHSSYEIYKALAICADLGVNYYNPDKDFSFSVVLKNLGGQVKRFNENYDRLPWDIQIGFGKSLGTTPLRLSITAYNLNKWSLPYYSVDDGNVSGNLEKHDKFMGNLFRHLIFGLEYVPSEKFYIALGYNYKTRTDMSTYARNFLSGFSAGAGLKVKAMGFGVAFAQPHVGGTTFMFNLTASVSEMLR